VLGPVDIRVFLYFQSLGDTREFIEEWTGGVGGGGVPCCVAYRAVPPRCRDSRFCLVALLPSSGIFVHAGRQQGSPHVRDGNGGSKLLAPSTAFLHANRENAEVEHRERMLL